MVCEIAVVCVEKCGKINNEDKCPHHDKGDKVRVCESAKTASHLGRRLVLLHRLVLQKANTAGVSWIREGGDGDADYYFVQ